VSPAPELTNSTWPRAARTRGSSTRDALRGEEARHGVRVMTVYPGRTATPMQEKVHAQEGADYDADRWIDPAR
jgi:NAD(P)-dependent dehydrogenase (short-subunit alcohol dehydrogenase family)